jgi:hypothetical protein
LATSGTDLLVWNIGAHEFGLMPLRYVASNETVPASLTPRSSASAGSGGPTPSSGPSDSTGSTSSPAPSTSPSTVLGTRWFNQTRGFVVTGPAAFKPDGSAFAVYAQVGSRRRLVVSRVGPELTNQIEVLAIAQAGLTEPTTSGSLSRSATPVSSGASGTASESGSGSGSKPASASASASAGVNPFHRDGFPIAAPLVPVWWGDQVVAVGNEGTVASYLPESGQAIALDLGVEDVTSLATAP